MSGEVDKEELKARKLYDAIKRAATELDEATVFSTLLSYLGEMGSKYNTERRYSILIISLCAIAGECIASNGDDNDKIKIAEEIEPHMIKAVNKYLESKNAPQTS